MTGVESLRHESFYCDICLSGDGALIDITVSTHGDTSGQIGGEVDIEDRLFPSETDRCGHGTTHDIERV